MRNNLLSVDKGFAYDWSATSSTIHSSDYNQFDLGAEAQLANLGTTTVASHGEWVIAHAHDINSVVGEAMFVDPDGTDGISGYQAELIGPISTIDDGDPGFSTEGSWSSAGGYGGDSRYSSTAGSVATWTFDGLTPGTEYRLAATFPRSGGTTSANYRVFRGGTLIDSTYLNQWYRDPHQWDYLDDGVGWSVLGDFQAEADGILEVRMTGINFNRLADAIRLQQVVKTLGRDDDFHVQVGALAVDHGDPTFDVVDEPVPNGGRINIGAYGGTTEATVSDSDEILQVLSPSGPVRFSAGEVLPIRWRSQVAGPVNIELYAAEGFQDGVSIPLMVIADDLVAPEGYDWTIPTDGSVPLDDRYLVRIQAISGSMPNDVSNYSFSIANAGNSYYINDDSTVGDQYTTAVGNDINLGKSPDQPMATLRTLLNAYSFAPGDTVYIDSGIYSQQFDIVLDDSLNSITFQGPRTDGASAIINRGGSGKIFQIAGADGVTISNLNLTNATSAISSQNSPDSDGIKILNNRIYANAEGIYISSNAVDDLLISGNTVFEHPSYHGIYVDVADADVRGNVSYGNKTGIEVRRGAVANANEVFSNETGMRLRGGGAFANRIHDNTTGVNALSWDGVTGPSLVEDNEVFHNETGINVSTLYSTIPADVIGNRVYDNQTGLYVSGYRGNSWSVFGGTVAANQIYSNSLAAQFTRTSTDTAFQNNLVYGSTNLGLKLVNADSLSLVNNTIVHSVGDVLRIEGASSDVEIRNNILSIQSGHVLNVAADSFANHLFDYNLLQQGTDPNAHIGLWGSTVLDTLSEWQTTTGLDANSVTGDPGFLDMDGADNILGFIADNGGYDGGLDDNFLLTAGSIAIDRGETASAPEFDILGNARVDDPGIVNAGSENGFVDLGSYEFQGDSSDSTPPTVVGSVPVAVHASGGIVGSLTEITLSLSEAINEIDANAPAAYSLLFSGADGNFGNLDDNLIEVSPTYEAGSTTISLAPAESLEYGSYRLTLFGSTTLHDASGLRLDGDGDAAAGGDYVREFSLEADLPPTSSDVSLTIDEDVETAINLVGDDGNPAVEQNLIFEITSLPEHGTLSRTAGGTVISLEQLPLQLTSSTVYFKPAAHSHQGSNFTFITRDDDGSDDDPSHQSDPATVSISITPVNDPPVVAGATVELGELSAFGITVATMNADDPDLLDATTDSLSYAIVAGNDDGIFQITQTGRVVLVAPDKLDFESKPSHELTVRVTDGAGVSDTGVLTITLIDEAEAQVDEIIVGGGENHRSRVDLVTVTFNRLVELDFATGGPFRLVHVDTGDAIDLFIQTLIVDDKTVAELRFGLGPHVDSDGNLSDGRYQLTVRQTHVSAEGFALDGNGDGAVGDDFVFGAEEADQFFRFFGDSDGDGDVDGQDYGRFGLTFLKSEGEEGYNPLFDYDGDGDVDGQDYGQFGLRFLKQV